MTKHASHVLGVIVVACLSACTDGAGPTVPPPLTGTIEVAAATTGPASGSGHGELRHHLRGPYG